MKKFEVVTDIYFGENALNRLKELTYQKFLSYRIPLWWKAV